MKTYLIWIGLISLSHSFSYAAHPLITDDAGTVGRTHLQFELNGSYSQDRREEQFEQGVNLSSIFSYGIHPKVDCIVGIPVERKSVRELGKESVSEGIGDIPLEFKWRFLERNSLNLALKAGTTFPTGEDQKGFGTGEPTFQIYGIASKEFLYGQVHINIGYLRNNNTSSVEENLWHASFAGDITVSKNLRTVLNLGMEKNPARNEEINPAFLLGGFIYSVTPHIDVDFGVKRGLNRPETDLTLLTGTALKY